MKRQIEALLSNAIFAILGLFSFIIVSHNVQPHIFGSWMLFLSVSTFIDMVRFGLTRNAVIQLISGQSPEESHNINGIGLRIGIEIMIILSTIMLSLWFVGVNKFPQAYSEILLWYPLVGFSNLFWNNAVTWLQGNYSFAKITLLRSINMVSFIVMLLILLMSNSITMDNLIIIYIISNAFSSVFGFIRGWDSAKYSIKASTSIHSQILNFGKYSILSNIGSSILKSADSFIIGLSPILGVTAVAIYAIPFKVIEMLELPIRSVSMVAFNHLSENFRKSNKFTTLAARYCLIMCALTTPAIVLIALFPNAILYILGGNTYQDNHIQMITILYCVLLYGIMLIPDRLTGVIFEASGKPQFNTLKVLIMATTNIIGDLIAVFVFHSLIGVIFVTVIFVVIGVTIGYFFIPKYLRPSYADFCKEFTYIAQRCKMFFHKITNTSDGR